MSRLASSSPLLEHSFTGAYELQPSTDVLAVQSFTPASPQNLRGPSPLARQSPGQPNAHLAVPLLDASVSPDPISPEPLRLLRQLRGRLLQPRHQLALRCGELQERPTHRKSRRRERRRGAGPRDQGLDDTSKSTASWRAIRLNLTEKAKHHDFLEASRLFCTSRGLSQRRVMPDSLLRDSLGRTDGAAPAIDHSTSTINAAANNGGQEGAGTGPARVHG